MGRNSGVSRKRFERPAFTAAKDPKFELPEATLASAPTLPNEPNGTATAPFGFPAPSPDRVTALTTRLVFSPYSGVGKPVLSSMDCTALLGSCVENTLLIWSLMGCPSI